MSSSNCDNVSDSANFFSTVQKPFPNIEEGKINTLDFIDAARGVVTLVEKLGSVFTPVKYDMNGNIEKILKRYDTDVHMNGTLHDMALREQAEGGTNATEALLWLTRALHFIELFLEQILNEATETAVASENISKELAHAYSLSVKPYHGWVTQKLFTLVFRLCPTRSQFFSSLEMTDRDRFFKDVEYFTHRLRENRMEIQSFYAIHKLGNNNVV